MDANEIVKKLMPTPLATKASPLATPAPPMPDARSIVEDMIKKNMAKAQRAGELLRKVNGL